ncbi:Smr domain-containing protein [Chitinophaga sp. CF118]|uniref:Smr/MutS family protein n=1 Tax=Chitinophaga sp. CF118 TaxID=1884367 RepID=UPI0008E8EE0E|nr:Smr/MutS family protein [Chitinophaga sp. CF118]SFE92113.1 Smr domain-containing protein [Chitinophaga sp. CF118]
MKYEIGDKILLLHSKEEGTVVDIINAEMVMVEVGKVSFPVYLDQIDFPYFHRFTAPKVTPPPTRIPGWDIKPEKKQETFKESKGVFLSVLPVFQVEGYEENVQVLKFHLLNETQMAYRFHFQVWLKQRLELEIRNDIDAFKHFYLSDLLFESLNDSPRLEFTFYPKENDPTLAPAYQKIWKIKPKQLFQQLNELKARRDATLSYPLFEKYPIKEKSAISDFETGKIGNLAAGANSVAAQAEPPLQPKYELDLHIEHLLTEWRGLNNVAILAIQLNEFQRYLDLAIVHHQHTMIVIHGLGRGKLKEEIHAILKQTNDVERFVNEYHPRYGYGATEIFFKH